MIAVRIRGIFGLTQIRTKPDVLINDRKSHAVINFSEYSSVAIHSEPELQVFPKRLKQLTKVQMS
jgi:hypothetical protein